MKKRLSILVFVLIAVSSPTVAQKPAAVPSPVLKALEEESRRAFELLRKQGDPAPYFISYSVSDVRSVDIEASQGALRSSQRDRSRLLDVDVRVGDYQFDNTHQIRGARGFSSSPAFSYPVQMPVDDDVDALKSVIWLETDRKYKAAVERFIQVKANRTIKVEEEDNSADLSRENKRVAILPSAAIDVNVSEWEKKLKSYSALFKKYPGIYEGNVSLSSTAITNYLVNSEDTSIQHGTARVRLSLYARTKADDGMELYRFESFDGHSINKMPSDATVQQTIEKMAQDLKALRVAPVIEPYTGPAILSGRASGVFFHEIFGHRIEGHRQKSEEEGQTFTKKVNQPVLPDFISVIDDPTAEQIGGIDLNGNYTFDDDGVTAQRVSVVDKGVLKNFLMSRSPVSGFEQSNGHGRKAAGFRTVGRQGNLIVQAADTVSEAKLRAMLIEEAKKQGKPFGLLFKDISGGFTVTGRTNTQSFQVTPIMVYRIFVDGKPDELVRGVDLIGTPLTSFSKIVAAGDKPEIFNGFCGAESGFVPVAAVSPSILTTQIEVQKKAKSSDRPPILTPPGTSQAPDPVMRAISDELQRSVNELQFKDLEKPYFIQYVLLDQEQYRAEATFGALTASDRSHSRLLQAQVRVGNYDFDNSEFQTGPAFQGPPPTGALTSTVIEDDYNAVRHSLWLATDSAYKQAVEQLARKRAFVQNTVREERIPDFSKEEPFSSLSQRRTLEIDQARWEKQLREWSAIFREFPDIQESTVTMRALLAHRYLVNSEGTRTLQPTLVVSIEAEAGTQAPDGMRLSYGIPFNARSFDQLPNAQSIASSIRQMAAQLTALRSSPVLEADYSGPVLLTGQASAEMFARLLAPNVSGQRLPLTDRPDQQGSSSRSELVDRMNRPVLPSFLSVFDDPTQQHLAGQELIGHYQVDDQGVPARRVSLIEEGVLKTFLMSRRPNKDMPQSNGHGRSTFPGRETAQIGNLFVQSNEGKSYDDLKQQLIKICRAEKLQYGILIKAVDSDGRGPVGTPVLAYKVYVADGREELVRGTSAGGITVRSLRQIEAVGNDAFVSNRLPGSGGIPTPTAVIAPSVLLEEMELKRPSGAQQRPALLTHPYFRK